MPTTPDIAPPVPYRPSVAEATLGWVYGVDPRPADVAVPRSPAAALELAVFAVLAAASSSGPCFVAFSGGRDSSTVLAVAVHVARRRGLPEPIAVTLRYPALPETDERSWQESVVRHVGLQDWVVVELCEENGLTGPNAAALLAAHGPYFPYAAHASTPVARTATGGVVLTGEGGDLVLAPHRTWALANIVERRGRVEAGAWRAAARGLAPSYVRAQRAGNDAIAARPWLTPAGADLARRAGAGDARGERLAWPAETHRTARLCALRAGLATVDAVYQGNGARVHHPFLDPLFVAALAVRYGVRGPLSRGRVVADLAGDLLPSDLPFRRDKCDFTRVLLTPDVRQLVSEWDGVAGVDQQLIAPERLREEWRKDRPSAMSLQLLLEVVHATRFAGVAQ